MRRLIVLVLSGVLFVGPAACGGGDKKSSEEGQTKTSADASDKSTTTESNDASSTTEASSSAAAASLFTSADCTRGLQAISAAYGLAGLAMSGQTDQIDKTEKDLTDLASKAPKEIQGDLETIQNAYGEYGRIIRDSGWKPSQGAPPQSVVDALEKAGEKLDSEEVKAANAHVESWFKDECGH